MRQQPAFWLEVRKDYVVDNYERLMPYLRGYHYDARYEYPDSDFNKTFDCLQEIVNDIQQLMADDNVFHHAASNWDEPLLKKRVGLLAAYLLSAQKKGIGDDHALITLCDILLNVEKNPDTSLLSDMRRISAACAANREVVTYGFNWDDVDDITKYASLSLFCRKASKVVFRPDNTDESQYIEGKGLMVTNHENVSLAPMNWNEYAKKGVLPQMELPIGLKVEVAKGDITNKTDFPELIDTCTDILRSLDNVVPSVKKELKTYESGDEILVRILSNKFGYVYAETIDPNYARIEGQVFIPFKLFSYFADCFTVTKDSVIEGLRVDDTLKVRVQSIEHYPFILDQKIMRDFSFSYIERTESETCDAIYMHPITKGHQWLTDSGLLVNVFGDVDADVQQAIDNDMPIRLRVNASKKDKNGNWVVNGKYVTEETAAFQGTREDFLRMACDNFVDAFLDSNYVPPTEIKGSKKSAEASPFAVPLLVDTLYRSAQVTGDTTLRYQHLFAGCFAATIVGQKQSAAYLRQQMRYQECLVHFALGDQTASTLKLREDDSLPHLEKLNNQQRIIEQLSKYQDMNVERLQLSPNHEVDINYVNEMVTSSNVLKGKLDPVEMNRIKKSIAAYLGVADIYRNINHDYTDYGDESDTLEFKTSIVYPPDNNMKPDTFTQKWAILRAVCGFLNTVTGGEILLGVNDNGMAIGLSADMEYLYTRHFIGSQTMDSYRRYVKNIIDNAFVDDKNKSVAGIDITSPRVYYDIEHNNEGADLLRIKVQPYEYGIVAFKDDYLPLGTARSYYRTSGASVKMDDKLRQQVLDRKMNIKTK